MKTLINLLLILFVWNLNLFAEEINSSNNSNRQSSSLSVFTSAKNDVSTSASTSLVGSSEHFEFYTDLVGKENYWLEIKDALEEKYQDYCGRWNLAGMTNFMDDTKKTKIYYTEKENISHAGNDILDLKSGYFNRNEYSIYISPLNTSAKKEFYGDLKGLAINTFAGYAVRHRILRDGWEDYLPPYFIEGYGLYEQGYQPVRDSVISYLQHHTEALSHDVFLNFKNFQNSSKKDILVAHYQFLLLFQGYKYIYWFYGNIVQTEINFFYYFYTSPDNIQIKNYASSENFDIYCSSRDTMFIDSMKVWLERTRQYYIDSFQMEINVRYPLLVMYDEQTGMDLTGYGHFNGGAGAINISPINFYDGIEGYPFLIAHEFGHVFNDLMYKKFPFGFYHEGMANLSAFIQYGSDWANGRPRIEAVLYYFLNRFGKEPSLSDFIDNPYEPEGGNIDPYYFGLEFSRYLYETEGLLKIREFFNKGMDFSVFSQSYAEIEKAYIKRLKLYRNLYPTDTIVRLPFNEPFNNFFNGWIKPSYNNEDNWQIIDRGINGTNCTRFYTSSNKNVPLESWLVSPAIDAKNMNGVNVSFDFARFGEGIELQMYYTKSFDGNIKNSDWTFVKSINMPTNSDWSNSGIIGLTELPDTVFIGLVNKSTGEQQQQLYIDNFTITEQQEVETRNAEMVNYASANLYGLIMDNFNETVSQRGFYWSSINSDPGPDDNIAIAEVKTQSFSFNLKGLTSETTYYYKAFGATETETKTGDVKQFTTAAAPILAQLPFYDDFSKDYANWTANSVIGADQWHLSGDDGIGGSKCARFYITSIPIQANDDWLVSPLFNSSDALKITISFKYWYHDNGIKPEFYYSNEVASNPANSEWIKIDNSFWKTEWTWKDGTIEIENPGDSFVFAIRYQSTTTSSNYILIDNLSIISQVKEIPLVLTNNAISESSFSATLNGTVSSDGGAEITQRGFYWSSTNVSPGAEDQIELVSGTTGQFTFSLNSLTPETTYFFRSFATNNAGTALGEVKQITTAKPVEIPVVLTNEATNIDHEVAVIHGEITSNGGAEITECGFYWSETNSNPVANNSFIEILDFATSFSVEIKKLSPGKVYYYRSFATNSAGTALGEVKQFTTINTASEINSLSPNDFKIYPNPTTGESFVEFQIKKAGPVNISVYDIRGSKICILLDKYMLSGIHTFPLGNQIKTNGIYLCKLTTDEGVSTLKLIVNR